MISSPLTGALKCAFSHTVHICFYLVVWLFFSPSSSVIFLFLSGCCVTPGDGGGGDGSSGSEESGNDGGVSTIPLPSNVQTTYDALRGLGIVGSSAAAVDDNSSVSHLPAHGRNSLSLLTEVGVKEKLYR